MRIPRIYLPQPLVSGNEVELDANALRHAVHVLRLKPGNPLILFNGLGGEYMAELTYVEKRRAKARVGAFQNINRESNLFTHLGLGISKAERMDFALQKAVELGVSEITPLFTEHCVVQLSDKRVTKKQEHWQAVIISACEQTGRNTIPVLNPSKNFVQWFATLPNTTKLILEPAANMTLSNVGHVSSGVTLAIGPEGGFSQAEVEGALKCGFQAVSLGTRILRTESAAIAGLAAIQALWGDFV
jgi:16S rRNA (uracil1498-N3)-methyltransferase